MYHHEEEKHGCPAAPVVLNQDSECAVYGYADSPDTLRLTAYPVFPGIELIYNDIHADLQMRPHDVGPDLLEINHCHEGRMEVQNGAESFFLAPGDLSVSRLDVNETIVRFPTGHYHGITVRIDSKRSPDCLSCFMQDMNVRICLWKIYGDEDKAKRLCARYQRCTECYCRMWKNGRRLEQLAVAS